MIHIGNKLPVLVAFLLLVGGVTLVLSQNPTLLAYLVDVCEYLEGANFVWYSIPISILDLCGSILSCNSYRQSLVANKRQVSWLESLVACTLAQFGGTTLTGAILGQVLADNMLHIIIRA
jgi:Na+/citrate or Na+/malate symporter